MQRLLDVPAPDTSYVAHTRDHDDARGFLLYDGPGRLDGAPVFAVATLGRFCTNTATGPMHQVWVMRSDLDPLQAAYVTGDDASVCGDCVMRPVLKADGKRGADMCFVAKHQAPLGVYRAYKRGAYPRLSERAHKRMAAYSWRFCGYGDTAVVPLPVWDWATLHGEGRDMAHTHMWDWAGALEYASMAMASVHTPYDAGRAIAAGWRAYMLQPEGLDTPSGMMRCAKQREAKRLQCADCGGCAGTRNGAARYGASVAAWIHGPPLKGMNPRDAYAAAYGAAHTVERATA
ncbi:MAG: hypothetical protein HN396_04650 [Gemmatimonadales bacterium]|jgi:hypothetical protein|nr:hypothetical protein [Gemmatimonadales bacterium]